MRKNIYSFIHYFWITPTTPKFGVACFHLEGLSLVFIVKQVC